MLSSIDGICGIMLITTTIYFTPFLYKMKDNHCFNCKSGTCNGSEREILSV